VAIIPLKCSSCGATLEADDTRESWSCAYCGTKIIKDKEYITISGEFAVNGIASTESLLERAFLFIEDGDFQKAYQYLERVLDVEPNCWKAYIGELLCQLNMRKIKDLEGSAKVLTVYDNYNKAIRFAVGEDAIMLRALDHVVVERLEPKKLKYEETIRNLQNEIALIEQYLSYNKINYKRFVPMRIAWSIFEVICILLSAFFIFGTIIALPFLILSVPAVIGTVFVILKNHKIKKQMAEYSSKKSRHTLLNWQLSQVQQVYSNLWKCDLTRGT
jgi:hypothetical protein